MSHEGRIKAYQKVKNTSGDQVEIKVEDCSWQRLSEFFKTYKSFTIIEMIVGP